MASLVKQLDKVVADNSEKNMAAIVNFMDLDKEVVAKFAEDNEIKHVALVVTDKKNADRFKINEAAELTVMHYKGKKIKANYAVAKGELDAKTVTTIVESTSAILEDEVEEEEKD